MSIDIVQFSLTGPAHDVTIKMNKKHKLANAVKAHGERSCIKNLHDYCMVCTSEGRLLDINLSCEENNIINGAKLIVII